jgi:hypothetical protein
MTLNQDPLAESVKKMQGLMKATGVALEDLAAHAAGYGDHAEFRRALVAGLDAHPAFVKAVRAFHGQAKAAPPGAKGQAARRVAPAGRVQAPRHDSPRGARKKSG